MATWEVSFNLRVDISDPAIVSTLARITAIADVFRTIPVPPAAQVRMDTLNILRAVVGTTGLEGTELTEDEVGRMMDAPPGKMVLPPSRRREEMEGRNAERVMRSVAETLREDPHLPLTEQLICTLHKLTTEGIDYENNEPGVYRSHPTRAGTYVPPRERGEIRRLMEVFVHWFNNGLPTSWPAAVQAIVAHFYVVSIHPFGDGNGRTARAVESFLLYKGGINVRGFYSLANHYYRHRDRYIELLDSSRFSGERDLTPFVRFALEGLLAGLQEVHEQIVAEIRVIAFRDMGREVLDRHGKLGSKAGARLLALLYDLAREPVHLRDLRRGSHPLFRLYKDLSSKTLSRDLRFLVEQELVLLDADNLRANIQLMDRYVPGLRP
jgi:Fic family protein